MILDQAATLEVALDSGDADAEIGRSEDGGAYVLVTRDGRVLYAEAGLDDDGLGGTTEFLSVLIGGGAL